MTTLIIYEVIAVLALVGMGILEVTQSHSEVELRSSQVKERK